jgi:thymidylate kinase
MLNNGIIILDGADCAGKTTLAKWFIQNCGARYLHLKLYKDLFMHQVASYRLAERWASRGELVIIDRHWISELAYGDCLRHGVQNPISVRFLDRLFLRSAALTILCVPADSKKHLAYFKENKERRNEMFDEVAVGKVIDYYQWLVGNQEEANFSHHVTDYAAVLRRSLRHRPDFMVYDFEKDGQDLNACGTFMLAQLARARKEQYIGGLDEGTPNFCGHTFMAKSLLVGEMASGDKILYPFSSRDSVLSSSLWLNRALDVLDVSEHELCWVNALDRRLSQKETSIELQELTDRSAYRWEHVVALGRTAARHLKWLGLKEDKDFVKIPHPQWARRFKHFDHRWYTEILGEALGIDR